MATKEPKCDYKNWDGQKYEEDKATYRKKITGPKSRLSWGFSDIKDDDWPFKKREL